MALLSKRASIAISLILFAVFGTWKVLQPFFSDSYRSKVKVATVVKSNHKLEPFSLVDTNAKPFTDNTLRGKWNLMFFGYTQCPDICPTTLNVVKNTWRDYYNKKQQPPASFIFASINTETDKQQTLRKFLNNYDSNFIGITGKNIEMQKLQNQLGVFSKHQQAMASGIPIIDHTAALFLLDPNGKLAAIFTPPLDHKAIYHDLNILTKAKM